LARLSACVKVVPISTGCANLHIVESAGYDKKFAVFGNVGTALLNYDFDLIL